MKPTNTDHLGQGKFFLDLLAFPADIVVGATPPAVVASFAFVLENML